MKKPKFSLVGKKEKFSRKGVMETLKLQEATISAMADTIDTVQFLMSREGARSFYRNRNEQITELIKKYTGESSLSNLILQRCINLRVAFSIPNRLFLIRNPNTDYSEAETKDAKEFLNSFLEFNQLDSALPRELAKESELYGQVAVRLKWDEENKIPSISYYPSQGVPYKIECKDPFVVNSELVLNLEDVADVIPKADRIKVPDKEFVFIAFNDLLNKYIGYPTCGGVLRMFDNLEKDLEDWRILNHLFAHPTPHFKCENKEDADDLEAYIAKSGWKVGTAISTNGDFRLVGPSGTEAQMLMASIQTLAKIISGHTGIGIHFLGFANVMSNRSTADSMGEPTEVVLHSEITSWRGFYTKLFKRAIRMRNEKLQKGLHEDAILPWLVPLTDRQWKAIKDVYMPLREIGEISRETMLSNIPGIDVQAEMDRIDEEEKKAIENQKPKDKEEEEENDGEEENQDENEDEVSAA